MEVVPATFAQFSSLQCVSSPPPITFHSHTLFLFLKQDLFPSLPLMQHLTAPRLSPPLGLGRATSPSFSRCLPSSSVPANHNAKVLSTAVLLFPQVLLLSLEGAVCCGEAGDRIRPPSAFFKGAAFPDFSL